MPRKIATVLVMPRTLFREGLVSLLSGTDYGPVLCFAGLSEVEAAVSRRQEELLFVIDADAVTLGKADAEFGELRARYPASRMIVLSASLVVEPAVAALRAGATGYLMSTMTFTAMLKSFDVVMQGDSVIAAEVARAVCGSELRPTPVVGPAVPPPLGPDADAVAAANNRPISPAQTEMRKLSDREISILAHLVQGKPNKSIAQSIGVAEATVKTHIKAILRKIHVRNRTQAALWAYTNLALPDEQAAIEATPHTAVGEQRQLARRVTGLN